MIHTTIQRSRHPRGMALLLVMVGLVVCTILTAGFLASQGTSLGIARNERDAQKSRALAQTGLDMALWQIKNTPTWRTRMSVGNWLTNAAVGDGTVTVQVAAGANQSNFYADPTSEVIVTSTGTYDSRTSTLRAVIRPTGGGTVFYNGNFFTGNILLGNSDKTTTSIIDSYNSSVAPYNSLLPGSNASFGSASNASGSLYIYSPSVFRGAYTAGPTATLASAVTTDGLLALAPSSVSNASETRSPGKVIPPNTAGLASQSAFNKSSGTYEIFPGNYPSFSASGCTVNVKTSGIYYIPGNFTINSVLTNFIVADGVSAIVLVDGNITVNGPIKLSGAGKLALYSSNTVTLSNGSINSGGSTSNFTLYGTPTCTLIQLKNTSSITGSIYAPQTTVSIPSSTSNKGQIYGAVIANTINIQGYGQIHFDEALRSLKISNTYLGSASPGTPDYSFSLLNTPCTAN